jgi:hypothetical protein
MWPARVLIVSDCLTPTTEMIFERQQSVMCHV